MGFAWTPDVTTGAVSSYLAISPLSANGGRCISVALSVGLPRLGVTQHSALWSSDFPHLIKDAIIQPACILKNRNQFSRFASHESVYFAQCPDWPGDLHVYFQIVAHVEFERRQNVWCGFVRPDKGGGVRHF